MFQPVTLNQVSFVIPVFNEADNVCPLLEKISKVVEAYPSAEVVVVDDGSKDETWLRLLSVRFPQLRCVRHVRNFGQSAAFLTGAQVACNDWLVTLDGDGQNDSADAFLLIESLNKHQDPDVIVVGNRVTRKDTGFRRFSSRIANWVRQKILQDNCADTGCSLKLFRRDLFLQIPYFNHCHRFLPALFIRQGCSVQNVPVSHYPRMSGQSKYGLRNRLWVGIVDLLGVCWLKRRSCCPKIDGDSLHV